jgi:transcriptional regulator with XRE-family HTH domain
MTFGQWLLKEISTRELDQADLARRTKSGTSTVSRWVNDLSMPTIENIVDIASALKLPPEVVFSRAAGLNPGDETLVTMLAREVPATLRPDEARLVVYLLRGVVQGIRDWNRAEEVEAEARLADIQGSNVVSARAAQKRLPVGPPEIEPG